MWRLKQWFKRIAQAWHNNRTEHETKKIARRWSAFAINLPRGPDGKLLLHIGCGDIDAAGFINLDARSQPHVHIVTDNLFRLKMIPDNVADLVYMSHVLEHVSHRQIIPTLREMRRILKEGGVLRISVPDFDKIIEIYQANDQNINAIQGALMGGQDYGFNFHYTAFNDGLLRKSILDSGFKEARTWNPADCEHHDFEDWASRPISWRGLDYPISLNIEAVK